MPTDIKKGIMTINGVPVAMTHSMEMKVEKREGNKITRTSPGKMTMSLKVYATHANLFKIAGVWKQLPLWYRAYVRVLDIPKVSQIAAIRSKRKVVKAWKKYCGH